jgi:hypothetical protein
MNHRFLSSLLLLLAIALERLAHYGLRAGLFTHLRSLGMEVATISRILIVFSTAMYVAPIAAAAVSWWIPRHRLAFGGALAACVSVGLILSTDSSLAVIGIALLAVGSSLVGAVAAIAAVQNVERLGLKLAVAALVYGATNFGGSLGPWLAQLPSTFHGVHFAAALLLAAGFIALSSYVSNQASPVKPRVVFKVSFKYHLTWFALVSSGAACFWITTEAPSMRPPDALLWVNPGLVIQFSLLLASLGVVAFLTNTDGALHRFMPLPFIFTALSVSFIPALGSTDFSSWLPLLVPQALADITLFAIWLSITAHGLDSRWSTLAWSVSHLASLAGQLIFALRLFDVTPSAVRVLSGIGLMFALAAVRFMPLPNQIDPQ